MRKALSVETWANHPDPQPTTAQLLYLRIATRPQKRWQNLKQDIFHNDREKNSFVVGIMCFRCRGLNSKNKNAINLDEGIPGDKHTKPWDTLAMALD